MKRRQLLFLLIAAIGIPAAAQVEELVSRYVQVLLPQGEVVQRIIRLAPPTGEGWREAGDARKQLSLAIPSDAKVDADASGSRVLQVRFAGGSAPGVVLRVDRFEPQEGEPVDVDVDYVKEYVKSYPEQAFKGRLTVTESGLLQFKKRKLAMVGGEYEAGGKDMFRVQCAFLSKERQEFLTFDCPVADRERFYDPLAKVLLSYGTADPKTSKK